MQFLRTDNCSTGVYYFQAMPICLPQLFFVTVRKDVIVVGIRNVLFYNKQIFEIIDDLSSEMKKMLLQYHQCRIHVSIITLRHIAVAILRSYAILAHSRNTTQSFDLSVFSSFRATFKDLLNKYVGENVVVQLVLDKMNLFTLIKKRCE